MQKVRIFHILLAIFILYGTIPAIRTERKQPPYGWFIILTILAFGAFGYHGYRFFESMR
jgi:hypothetical protein